MLVITCSKSTIKVSQQSLDIGLVSLLLCHVFILCNLQKCYDYLSIKKPWHIWFKSSIKSSIKGSIIRTIPCASCILEMTSCRQTFSYHYIKNGLKVIHHSIKMPGRQLSVQSYK